MRLTEFGSQTIYNAGGHFSGKPGAAQDGDGNTWIVGRDTSNGLWITRFSGSTKLFDNWIFLGGQAKGDPSVAVAPSGVVSYAVRDHWNGCWLGTFRPGIGSDWRNLGGIFATDPQITSAPPEVWVAGKDNWNGVWTLNFLEWFTPLQIPGWTFRGGILQGQLSLSHEGPIAVLAGRDQWNALWFAPFDRIAVLPWIHAQGILGRDPAIAATTAVVADNDSILLRPLSTNYPNFVVQSWVSTGGVLKSESAAWLDNSLYIVGRDAGNQIWWYRSATGLWTATGAAGVAASDITVVPR
ncbi:MAG: hypothetical protein JNN08_09150 [Bryobacterales bacterium]|nr:hypothetical protein [Bryobacterales bacterium]